MATPYIGQILVCAFNFAPKNFALCNGQLLSIQQNAALFSLLGTYYGGNGTTTFALPNLQGRCVLHQGASYTLGQVGGELNHTLLANELPAHLHPMGGSSAAGAVALATGNFSGVSDTNPYSGSQNTTLGSGSNPTGGGQSHANQSPYLVVNFCIALYGIFPSRN